MTALQLTAYELGAKDPAAHFPPEGRLKVQRRMVREKKAALSDSERRRRQDLAIRVQQRYPSHCAMGRAVNANGSSVGKWCRGELPVPDRYVEKLEQIAGGAA